MRPLLLLAFTAASVLASSPIDLPLWSGTMPGAPLSDKPEAVAQKAGDPIVRVTHVQKPDLRVFLPDKDKASGAAVIIYPGGGYGILAIDHEGYQIAQWLNTIGVAGIVCKYRGTGYQHPTPLLDARQALRVTREHAAEWGIDPHKVGCMGFSAGGHLASCVDTLFGVKLDGEDPAVFATMAHKPDFAALIYPVIDMSEGFGHSGSKNTLIGKDAPPELARLLSTQLQVTEKTPPTFLVSTSDDNGVPPVNSTAFYAAMFKHKVPGELHIWEKGGHGYGMLPNHGDVAAEWPVRMAKWLQGRGLAK